MSKRAAGLEKLASAGKATSGTERHVLTEIVCRLVAEPHPDRIYLFASHAREDVRPVSDRDRLVVVNERIAEEREIEQGAETTMKAFLAWRDAPFSPIVQL